MAKRMGIEENAPSRRANLANRDSASSDLVNDHSNPQEVTGATKAVLRKKEGANVQNQRSALEKSTNSPNDLEERRKLFVGGLPTDSK
ncbi:unnamed protein product [Pseudo-nitzschia multistriata]|uniref:Uncharacterized protein n=1 Tax=Pseudo-nitzschia multistriata TaxID=183589 RepID=A0A448Z475_9STRA|nr:unnamed protein product [Pseudo-nitzschia multistriata]